MKSVLASIKPKYCELIAKGEKTVEIRKTCPKIDTPFKVYIYCTLANSAKKPNNNLWLTDKTGFNWFGNGKVIGEFVCDDVHKFKVFKDGAVQDWIFADLKKSCLGYDDIADYVGRGKTGYAWHISNLVMYDKPRELSELHYICNPSIDDGTCYGCRCSQGLSYETGATICDDVLKRPPNSWCYVKEMG